MVLSIATNGPNRAPSQKPSQANPWIYYVILYKQQRSLDTKSYSGVKSEKSLHTPRWQ